MVVTDDDENDERIYTVTNPVADTTHRIVLFEAAHVSVDANGVVTFEEDGTTNTADEGTVTSDITVVNGSSQAANTTAVEVKPVSGEITFTVAGDGYGKVIPVVFYDADSDDDLDLNADDEPTESFGIGGQLTVRPVEAAAGNPAVADIKEISKADNWIIANDGTDETYFYDSNDRFYKDTVTAGNELTMAGFEAILTVGDDLKTTTIYQPNADLQSTFVLDNTTPAAIGSLTVVTAETKTTSVQLTVGNVATSGSPTVRIYGGKSASNAGTAAGKAAASVIATATVDASTTVTGFQVNVTGLTANTEYRFWATQEISGEETARGPSDAGTTVTTSAVAAALTPAATGKSYTDNDGAGAGAANDVLDKGDRFVFAFDRAVTVDATWSVNIADRDGVEVQVNQGNATALVSGATSNILTLTMSDVPTVVEFGVDGVLNTDTDVADALQVISSSGIGNATGVWNLPKSGLATNNGRDIQTTNIPTILTAAEVTTNASTNTVGLGDGHGLAENDVVYVYNANGTQIGTHTVTAGNVTTATTFVTTTGFDAGATLYIQYLDLSSNAQGQDMFSVALSVTVATPSFSSVSNPTTAVGVTSITLTFSQEVYRDGAFDAGDFIVLNDGVALAETDSAPITVAAAGTTVTLTIPATTFVDTKTLSVELTTAGAAKFKNVAGAASTAVTRTVTIS